jgi:AcrR family transcriptional regulator
MAEEKLSPELARLWRVATGSRLGRPASLDVDRVVRAAVDLADREGLVGVTLPKIASELGFTTMALYRHVGSKEELFGLMRDHAYGLAPDFSSDGEGWRDELRQWAHATAQVIRQHPWLAYLPVSGPPSGPNAIGWMDAGLRVLRDTGLGWGKKVGIVVLLSGYVRSASQLTLELEEGRRGSGRDQTQVEREYGRTLAKLVDPDRFPEAAKLFAAGAFESPPEPAADQPDPDFVFGLELILDGVAAAIDAAI